MDEKRVIEQIIETAIKLTQDQKKFISLFQNTGIQVNKNLSIQSINGSAQAALKKLMKNLTQMPVIKICAKQIIRKSGL